MVARNAPQMVAKPLNYAARTRVRFHLQNVKLFAKGVRHHGKLNANGKNYVEIVLSVRALQLQNVKLFAKETHNHGQPNADGKNYVEDVLSVDLLRLLGQRVLERIRSRMIEIFNCVEAVLQTQFRAPI